MPEIPVDFNVYLMSGSLFYSLIYNICNSSLERLISNDNNLVHVFFKDSKVYVKTINKQELDELKKSKFLVGTEGYCSIILSDKFKDYMIY